MNPDVRFAKEENLIRQSLFKFFPYWPLFLILLLFAVTATSIYLKIATPVYLSTATILINDEKKGAEDPKMMDNFNFFSSKKIIENETEVIHSRTLLTEVVKELSLNGSIFEKHQFNYTSAYLTSPIIINVASIINNKGLDQINRIPISYLVSSKQVRVNNKLYPLNQWITTPFGILQFSENKRRIKDATGPLFFSVVGLNEEISDLSSRISVTPVSKLSTIVRIEVEDEIPQRGNDILNSLAKAYYSSSLKAKNDMAENTLLFINNRIKLVEENLDSLERAIQIFKAKQGIVDLSVQGKEFIQNSGTNDQRIADINMKLAVLDQVEKYVISKDNKDGIVPSTAGVTDPILSSLIQKLFESETNYQKLKGLTAENNPMLVSLNNEIQKIRPEILDNIKSQRQSLQASRSNINRTNNNYSNALSTIPLKEKELLELTRQQGIVNNLYTFLLQKREETVLSYSSNIADNRIIDFASSSIKPVKPNKVVFYVASVFIALLTGIASIIAKEKLGGNILYRSEIEKATAFPVIAEIAEEKISKSSDFIEANKQPVAEQFRRLRASLLSMNINGGKRKILVTSAISGEGKSFIAANLGLTLAMAGKKVILLEFDLINPSLSNKLSINEEKGIASFLKAESFIEDIIKKTEVNSNLFIIPSGKLPNSPSDLIINGKVEELLAYLERKFDYIIIDTAPVSALSDAYILSPLCDLTLFVVRHNYTPKSSLHRLDQNNLVNGLKDLMLVFNGVNKRGFSNRSYGYDYFSGYSALSKPKKVKLLNEKAT